MGKEYQVSVVLGNIALLLAIFSFFAGMFYLQIGAILLASLSQEKYTIHWLAIGLAIVSLMIDLSTMYAIINLL